MALRTVAIWCFMTGALLAAAGYLGGTFLYLAPPNPLTLAWLPAIHAMLHPFFIQNWHLFAPNPVRTNLVLSVRCRVGRAPTPWHDPFTAWLARHHRSRLSPMGKVLRIPQNAMYIFLGKSGDDWRPLLCRRLREHPVCRGEDPAARRRQELGHFVLQRVGSAACDQLVRSGRAEGVQVRILIHEPPPWSKRHLPAEAGSTRYLELPWMPYTPWGRP